MSPASLPIRGSFRLRGVLWAERILCARRDRRRTVIAALPALVGPFVHPHRPGHLLNALHEAGPPRLLQDDLARTAPQHAGDQTLLKGPQAQNALFDAALADRIDHLHAARLIHAVRAADGLLQHRRVPG